MIKNFVFFELCFGSSTATVPAISELHHFCKEQNEERKIKYFFPYVRSFSISFPFHHLRSSAALGSWVMFFCRLLVFFICCTDWENPSIAMFRYNCDWDVITGFVAGMRNLPIILRLLLLWVSRNLCIPSTTTETVWRCKCQIKHL